MILKNGIQSILFIKEFRFICISRTCSNNENKIDSCLRRNGEHTCHSREGGNLGFIFFSKLQLLETQIRFIAILTAIFLCFNLVGCNSNSSSTQINPGFPTSVTKTNSASVKFNLLVPNNLKSSVITSPDAEFQLLFLNYGNATTPFTELKKISPISNNQAQVTFSNLPSGFVIAKVNLNGASINSQTNFIGIGDLFPGKQTTIDLAASGSLMLPDVLTNTALLIASDTDLTKVLPTNLTEQLVSFASALSQLQASNSQSIFQGFKAKISAATITQITAGDTHAMALRSDQNTFTWGDNSSGQLAGPDVSSIPKPNFSEYVYNASFLSAGGDCNMAIMSDGSVVGWGNNTNGQIPHISDSFVFPPVSIPGANSISKISVGIGHILALTTSGNILSWGNNSNGELGINKFSTVEGISNITTLNSVTQIAAGDGYSMALKSDGSVWAWGNNPYAQLATPISSSSTPLNISGISSVSKIAAGSTFCLALKSDGTVWSWGSNFSGECGIATSDKVITSPTQISNLTGITDISAGNSFAIALKSDGTVYSWGSNSSGQLGRTTSDIPGLIPGLSGIVKIETGQDFAFAIDQNNNVWSWGDGEAFQLGTANNTSSQIPRTVSFSR